MMKMGTNLKKLGRDCQHPLQRFLEETYGKLLCLTVNLLWFHSFVTSFVFASVQFVKLWCFVNVFFSSLFCRYIMVTYLVCIVINEKQTIFCQKNLKKYIFFF